MVEVKASKRKQMAIRGFQMLVISMKFNLGITSIGFLALMQFLWMIITNDKNTFILT